MRQNTLSGLQFTELTSYVRRVFIILKGGQEHILPVKQCQLHINYDENQGIRLDLPPNSQNLHERKGIAISNETSYLCFQLRLNRRGLHKQCVQTAARSSMLVAWDDPSRTWSVH